MLSQKNGLRTLAAVGIAMVAAAVFGMGPGVDFPFDRVAGEYVNVKVSAAPTSSGALDVHLSSDQNLLRLEAGLLRLEPAEDGLHKAKIDVTFSGEGELLTKIKVGSIPAQFEDQVLFPRQQQTLTAWVEIEAAEGGYRVTARQLPETISVDVESARAEDLVGLCRSISMFFVGDAGCEALESILERPKLPLPKPGSEFEIEHSILTEAERARLDLYLAGSKLAAVTR